MGKIQVSGGNGCHTKQKGNLPRIFSVLHAVETEGCQFLYQGTLNISYDLLSFRWRNPTCFDHNLLSPLPIHRSSFSRNGQMSNRENGQKKGKFDHVTFYYDNVARYVASVASVAVLVYLPV